MNIPKFIAFSDVHYADYGTGISVSDVAAVERAMTDACIAEAVQFCVFCGDRYLAHEPQDYIRVISDGEQKHRDDKGVVTFSLVGNHDLYAKAPVSGHSNRHLQTVWGDFLDCIVIMDEVKTYRHPKVAGVAVHAIPACFEWTENLLDGFDFRPDEFNLLVFHDMLQGSIIDHTTAYRAPKGRQLQLIDDARFQMVLGGDIHISQRLDFQHTTGGYVGAAIQQSRRDRGDARGWLIVDATGSTHVEGPAPRFVEAVWDLDDKGGVLPTTAEIDACIGDLYGDSAAGNIVDIVLEGSRTHLESVPADWHKQVQATLQARRVNTPILRARSATPIRRVATTVGCSPIEDLQTFLASGRVDLDGNSPERLLEKAAPILARLGGLAHAG